jgi:hypothetical protein
MFFKSSLDLSFVICKELSYSYNCIKQHSRLCVKHSNKRTGEQHRNNYPKITTTYLDAYAIFIQPQDLSKRKQNSVHIATLA